MNDPTLRRRAPLIPTISTLEFKKPAEPEARSSEECQSVDVIVRITIEIGSEPPKSSS